MKDLMIPWEDSAVEILPLCSDSTAIPRSCASDDAGANKHCIASSVTAWHTQVSTAQKEQG